MEKSCYESQKAEINKNAAEDELVLLVSCQGEKNKTNSPEAIYQIKVVKSSKNRPHKNKQANKLHALQPSG